MAKRKIINSKNIGIRSPFLSGIVFYLFLDKLDASEWVYGSVGLLFLAWIIGFIKDKFSTIEVDIFKQEKKQDNGRKN